MWEINMNIRKLLPKIMVGYQHISESKILIPLREIGVEVIIRKIQQISYLNQIILKLVNETFDNVDEIVRLTGIEDEIATEVIGEMATNDYLYVKARRLLLTPKGKEALKKLETIKYEKETINSILFDTVIGQFEIREVQCTTQTHHMPYLDEVFSIQDNIIISGIDTINDIYQSNLKLFSRDSSIDNEVFEVLRTTYNNARYRSIPLDIYISDLDKCLRFICDNDADSDYTTIFNQQIHLNVGAKRMLQPYSWCKKEIENKYEIDSVLKENRENLEQEIRKIKDGSEFNEHLNKLYFKNRYLFSGEWKEILSDYKKYRPTKICIASYLLKNILTDDIISILDSMLVTTEIQILYNPNEYKVDKLRMKVISQTKKSKKEINWIKHDGLSESYLTVDNSFIIRFHKLPLSVDNGYFIRDLEEIEFVKI